MKLIFKIWSLPTRDNASDEQFKKGKTPVARYSELRVKKLTVPDRAPDSQTDVVLFVYPREEYGLDLNVNWGWREYKLKKL